MKKNLLITFLVLTMTLVACGTTDEPVTDVAVEDTVEDTTETGKKVVLADTEKDENTEIGTIQNREPAEQTTQDGQAYDDLLEEEGAEKLEGEEFTVVPFQTTFYVSSETNVYEKPDSTSTVVGKVTYNTEITTTGKVEEVEWYKFQLDGKEAFISKSFLSEKKLELEETTPTTSTTPEQKEETSQEIADILEQYEQNNANTTNPFAGGFTVTGDGSNWDDGFVSSGRDYTVH